MPGGPQVLRVEADAEAPLAGARQHLGELGEAAADARALAGGELEEEAHLVARAERAADVDERARHAIDAVVGRAADGGAGMHDHLRHAERLGAHALVVQRLRRALPDRSPTPPRG